MDHSVIAKHHIPEANDEHREQQRVGLVRRRARSARVRHTIGHAKYKSGDHEQGSTEARVFEEKHIQALTETSPDVRERPPPPVMR
jgi:hypothetical protein